METATVADVTDVLPIKETPAAKPPAIQQPTNAIALTTPGDLLRLAVQHGANMDQLERLLALQQKYEEREAEKAFVQGMSAFKAEPIEIFKRKHVHFETRDGGATSYKHAELSDVTEAIAPAMARHGLSFCWDVHQNGSQITVDCIVTHVLGHSKKVTMSGVADASGKKNAIQQVASTVTYLQRYTLLAVTGMSTKDEDDDGAGGADDQPGTDTQQQRNTARPATRGAQSEKAPAAFYDQKKFDLNKDEWKQIVQSKRKTPAQLIKLIESKGAPLTVAQQNTIDSWSHEND